MEWDPTERDAWVTDAQRWIGQIKGVLQCKIDLDTDGEVTGVHVVAGMDREPRHIVRDVESLLKARLGLDVYYKKIGVVQVIDNGQAAAEMDEIEPATIAPVEPAVVEEAAEPIAEPTPDPVEPAVEPQTWESPTQAVLLTEEVNPRVMCSGVGVMASDSLVRAEVQLRAGELEARGTCEGPNHAGSEPTLVARATLEAVAELLAEPALLHLAEIKTQTLGGEDVIMVAIDLVEGRRSETLFGTCSAKHNRQQAVVFAVMDALNRRLLLFSLKSAEAGA